MARREATPEQKAKAEERSARFRELAETIAAMSDEARAAMAERMPIVTIEGRTLSPHNACLIGTQNPDATMVGGFQQWIKAGRCVRKGEHGLMMWAPTAGTLKQDEHTRETGELSSERKHFIMV